MDRRSRYSPEIRERAVRLVLDQELQHASQWAAMVSIASKIGCSPETLRNWVRRAERDAGRRPGLTTSELEELKQLSEDGLIEITEDRLQVTQLGRLMIRNIAMVFDEWLRRDRQGNDAPRTRFSRTV